MTWLWVFAVRVAAAASYLTLAVANPDAAKGLAGPYATAVFAVAACDFIRARRRRARSRSARG